MATVRATCDRCGDVEFTTADVIVRTCVETDRSTYVFGCPICGGRNAKDAAVHVVDLLVVAGAAHVHWHLPAELAEERHGGPLTHDDLLAFHDELAGDAWFERLQAMHRR